MMDKEDEPKDSKQPQEELQKKPKKPVQFIINGKTCSLYGLALNLGYMIVIPILVFGIGGVFLDKYLKSFPIFVFVGFFLAITSALLIVFVKMKEIMKDLLPKQPPKDSPGKHTDLKNNN